MARRFFESKPHTSLYSKYRLPVTNKTISPIFDYLSKSRTQPYDLIIDVGCGTGQATNVLSQYAKTVIGTDISEGQIRNANESSQKGQNVQYVISAAESMPFTKDNTVELVSSCQSFHWFDHTKFYQECHRILKPGGVLAVYVYGNIKLESAISSQVTNDGIADCLEDVYEVFRPYWDDRRSVITSKLEDISLPFDDVKKIEIDESIETDIGFVIGYFKTFSPYQAFMKKNPKGAEEFLKTIQLKLNKSFGNQWDGDKTAVTMIRPFVMMLGRKT